MSNPYRTLADCELLNRAFTRAFADPLASEVLRRLDRLTEDLPVKDARIAELEDELILAERDAGEHESDKYVLADSIDDIREELEAATNALDEVEREHDHDDAVLDLLAYIRGCVETAIDIAKDPS